MAFFRVTPSPGLRAWAAMGRMALSRPPLAAGRGAWQAQATGRELAPADGRPTRIHGATAPQCQITYGPGQVTSALCTTRISGPFLKVARSHSAAAAILLGSGESTPKAAPGHRGFRGLRRTDFD